MERQQTAKLTKTNSTSRNNVQAKLAPQKPTPLHPVLQLQRKIGNQAVTRLLRSGEIQAKLTISQPGDKYEQEADRLADQVMRMPEPVPQEGTPVQKKPLAVQITSLVQRESEQPLEEEEEETVQGKLETEEPIQRQAEEEEEEEEETLQTEPLASSLSRIPTVSPLSPLSSGQAIQRLCAECEDELVQTKPLDTGPIASRQEQVQRKQAPALTPQVTPSVSADIRTLQGGGSPLSPATLAFFEPRFGADFSQVRVHTDERTAGTAKSINAKAFTFARNIAFGAGQYVPESHEGQRLLAHELTHVVQQGGASLKGKGHNIQRSSGANLIQRAVTETKQDTHAGLFELSRHNPLGGPTFAPQAQYGVRIEFQPYQVVNCDQIAMTQTVLSRSGGALLFGSTARRNRSLTAVEGTEGLGIDRLSGRTSPLYGRNNTGTAAGNAHFGSRTGKGIGDKAWMTDTPGFNGAMPASSRTAGGPLSQHFETCAICNAGKDTGVYYGCVNWGFDIDAADKFTEDNFALVSKGTPSTDFLAAAKKWNDQTVPVATDDLPLPTHKTKQISMTEAQLKAEITTLETTLKGLAPGHVDIPQITFEIKVYKDILDAMSDNKKWGYSPIDIKAIQAVVGSTPNGAYDFDTIMKIKRWQVEQSLKGDGRFGPISKTKFDAIVTAAVTTNKAKGFTADQIKKIQVKVGSNDDGAWGPITVKNLMVWQKDHFLLATGEFDLVTRISMFLFGF